MTKDRMMAAADLNTCCRVEENNRDSRVFGFVTTGTLSILSRLLPAWMIDSMQ